MTLPFAGESANPMAEPGQVETVGDPLPALKWEGRTPDEWRHAWYGRIPETARPPVHIFERIGSTNSFARLLADRGAPAGTIVLADEQTAGRGRSGRSWHAPPGRALLLSIVLRTGSPIGSGSAPGTIPLRVGLAAARAIDRVIGHALGRTAERHPRMVTRIKWPNDLQLEVDGRGAKIAGVLCEGAFTAASGGYVVAGIGVNVAQAASEFPASIAQPATSIALATGAAIDRGELATEIITEIARIGDRLTAPLDAVELDEIAERDPLRGHPVTVDGEPAGIADGLTSDGALIIRGDDGRTIHLRHGTVRTAETSTLYQ